MLVARRDQAEALENIRSAIQEYLEVRDEILNEPGVELEEVTV